MMLSRCSLVVWILVHTLIKPSQSFSVSRSQRTSSRIDIENILETSDPPTTTTTTLDAKTDSPSRDSARRSVVINGFTIASSCILASPVLADDGSSSADDDESFASIAARANQISKEVTASKPLTISMILATNKTAYDFALPVSGDMVSFGDLIRQQYATPDSPSDPKVKAVLVVNIKQDDPIARKAIPELISLAAKYRGELAVVACPTDQGYYEPDTSQLIRLKLASEYGYGINPSTSTTDKVNLLGTGAVPFWRWLQSTCRTPAGLGRVEGNFEKFLLDGSTGLPLRRYPRKYRPLNIANDIEAVLAQKQLPPAGANYLEEWRSAAAEAERDTYRFEKGLNYFDQRL